MKTSQLQYEAVLTVGEAILHKGSGTQILWRPEGFQTHKDSSLDTAVLINSSTKEDKEIAARVLAKEEAKLAELGRRLASVGKQVQPVKP